MMDRFASPRWLAALALPLACLASMAQARDAGPAPADDMEINRNGSRPATPGPEANFTGSVRIEPVFDAHAPSTVGAGKVTFEPGARSAWHRHPRGQYLIVTDGLGWTQVEGGPITEMHPGDVIWCPPGVRHWHGASPRTAVTHIAVQEAVNGANVEWLEKVTDAEYARGVGPR